MSDNKLLAENTIRRFMKLANVDTLADNFIAENQREENLEEDTNEENLEETTEETSEEITEEEELELEEQMGEDDPDDDDDEPEGEDDAAEMDMEMGAVADDAAGPADMSLTEEEARVLIDLGKRLEEAMAGADESPADDEGMDEEGPEMDDDPAMAYGKPMEESRDEIVQEVLKRVTKRLVAEKLKA